MGTPSSIASVGAKSTCGDRRDGDVDGSELTSTTSEFPAYPTQVAHPIHVDVDIGRIFRSIDVSPGDVPIPRWLTTSGSKPSRPLECKAQRKKQANMEQDEVENRLEDLRTSGQLRHDVQADFHESLQPNENTYGERNTLTFWWALLMQHVACSDSCGNLDDTKSSLLCTG